MSSHVFVSDWRYPLFVHNALSSALSLLQDKSPISPERLSELGDLAILFTHMAYSIPYARESVHGEHCHVSSKAQFYHRKPVWELITGVADEKLTWCRPLQSEVSKIGAELTHILASLAEDVKAGMQKNSRAKILLVDIVGESLPLLEAYIQKRESESG